MIHEVTGRYRFSPPLNRSGNLVRRDGKTTEWWLILECDADLGRYWRWLYRQQFPARPALQAPLWGAHVTVIRDEKPPKLAAWKACEGEPISLSYEHAPTETLEYAWLPAYCAPALDYREALGLPREPAWPLHLTFGNRK